MLAGKKMTLSADMKITTERSHIKQSISEKKTDQGQVLLSLHFLRLESNIVN